MPVGAVVVRVSQLYMAVVAVWGVPLAAQRVAAALVAVVVARMVAVRTVGLVAAAVEVVLL